MNINYSQVLPSEPLVPSTITYISSSPIGHTYVGTFKGPNLQIRDTLPYSPTGFGRIDSKPAEATRYDSGKANWALMPFEAIEEILKVLEFGALKYDGWNFAKGAGMKWTRVSNSLLRHVFAWVRGEDKDPESGLSHLGHIGCNVIFLIYYMKYGEVYGAGDDRFKR